MTRTAAPFFARLFAAAVFASCAAFILIHTWVPARETLLLEPGTVSRVQSMPNAWLEAGITTASGSVVTCRNRRGRPVIGPNTCPVETLEPLQGLPVLVLHDGKRPYEITSGTQTVVGLSSHRKAQLIAATIASLLLVMSFVAWPRK